MNATMDAIAKAREETIAGVRPSQEAVVEAVGAWSKAVKGLGDELPAPKLEGFPTPQQTVESSFDFAQKRWTRSEISPEACSTRPSPPPARRAAPRSSSIVGRAGPAGPAASPMEDPWKPQVEALGSFIRAQRHLANLSLRELAGLANVSSAYLSQLERGMHQPSVKVLSSLARGLEISAETLLAQAGLLDDTPLTPRRRPGRPRRQSASTRRSRKARRRRSSPSTGATCAKISRCLRSPTRPASGPS